MTFQSPVDICNRGMQHTGAQRIDPTLGFAEDSRQASECSFVYDKVRRAELRRNVWRFATKLCVLRPFTTTTMELNPALWVSSTTYFLGALVTDAQGQVWISLIADNLGQSPGAGSGSQMFWEEYFGPLVCDQFQPNQDYYAGDVVYVAPGDGSYQVYISTMQSNGVSPTLPAVWLATNTYWKDQVVVVFPNWAVGTTYAAGNTVIDSAGNLWTSVVSGNVGHVPSTSTSAFWASYPAPAQYPLGSNVYSSGFVDAPTGGGAPLTFNNQQPTGVILEWNSLTSYTAGTLVDYKEVQYVAIGSAANLNLPPAANAAFWAPISNGTFYQSLVDLNTNQPPANGAIWTTTLTASATNGPGWLAIPNAYLTSPMLVYPLGSGPAEQSATRNVFQLPANFLKEAPQDPKAGSSTFLGAPTGLMYTDWEYQGDYIISRNPFPIVYRFVADVTLVPTFDDMFCEGLGARVGFETCFTLTQSRDGEKTCMQIYKDHMIEARLTNGIETGATEPAEDDFISTRL